MNRIAWIDWSKTVLIILVMIAHFWCPTIIAKFCDSFFMPAFFIISGYLYKKNNILWLFKRFMIPAILISLINILIGALFNIGSFEIFCQEFVSSTSKDFMYPIYYGFVGFWFVKALIISRLFWGDLGINIFRNNPINSTFFLIVFISLIYQLKIDIHPLIVNGLAASCFVGIGIILRVKNIDLSKHSLWTYLLLFLSGCIISMINKSSHMVFNEFGFVFVSFIISATLLSLCLFRLMGIFKSNAFAITFSQGTLFVLGTHNTIFNILLLFTPGVLSPYLWITHTIIVSVISYFLIKISLRHCPILLGK